MSRSSNPMLRDATFKTADAGVERMTLAGTVNKTAILLVLVFGTGACTWQYILASHVSFDQVKWVSIAAAIAGLVVALVTVFKPRYAKYSAPLYAVLEGVAIGSLSLVMELMFPGIVLQAVCLTFATFACLLMAYKSGFIKVTQNFRLGVIAATGGVALVYVFDFLMQWAGYPIGFIHDSSWYGIGFSLMVVCLAALNLVLDFDFIETGVERGASKYMEWYGAFGLIVTLVWLYLEILRLLGKARR